MEELKALVGKDETILWQGKPSKKCFILESIFNPMFPFALIWLIFDLAFMIGALANISAEGGDEASLAIIPVMIFLLLHMMPVWIYLGGLFLIRRRYKNSNYIITDKGIYISQGTIRYQQIMKPFAEINNLTIHRGIFDQWLNVGDVCVSSTATTIGTEGTKITTTNSFSLINLPNYMEIFNMVKKLQTDITTDMMYPNEYRPKVNPGYQTKYVNNDMNKNV